MIQLRTGDTLATSLSSSTSSSCIDYKFQRKKGCKWKCFRIVGDCSGNLQFPSFHRLWRAILISLQRVIEKLPSSERDYIAGVRIMVAGVRQEMFLGLRCSFLFLELYPPWLRSYHMATYYYPLLFPPFIPPCAVRPFERRENQKGKQKEKKKKKREGMCIIKEERSVATVAHKALGSRSSLLCGIFVLSLAVLITSREQQFC